MKIHVVGDPLTISLVDSRGWVLSQFSFASMPIPDRIRLAWHIITKQQVNIFIGEGVNVQQVPLPGAKEAAK